MSESATKPRRRWYQFSLRTLLLVIALGAGIVFAWTKCIEPNRRQREAMAVITKLGGSYKTEEATGWIRYLDSNAQDVVVVDLADCDKPDEYLPHLARLPKLRTLVVGGHSVGDEQLTAVERFASLHGIVLDSTKVTEESVKVLKNTLPELEVYRSHKRAFRELVKLGAYIDEREGVSCNGQDHLARPQWLCADAGDVFGRGIDLVCLHGSHDTKPALPWLLNVEDVCVEFDGTNISDDGLAYVAQIKSLRAIAIRHATRVTDAGIKHFEALPHLRRFEAAHIGIGDASVVIVATLPEIETVNLSGTLVTDDGLTHLALSKTLKWLRLEGSTISDRSVPHLRKCVHLCSLDTDGTSVSPSGVQTIKEALPLCDINCTWPFLRLDR